jgi:hypothetical protein
VLGGQFGQGPVLGRAEHRRRGAVPQFDERQARDGIEVFWPGDPHGDGPGTAPRRRRLDAIGAVAPEPEVRQRLGQPG